jgi:hypothetical protein
MLELKTNISFKIHGLYLLVFSFYSQRKGEQENVRFIVNQDTVLNIIPVDYVAKVVNTFER